jgi:hypothetical protein
MKIRQKITERSPVAVIVMKYTYTLKRPNPKVVTSPAEM